MTSYKPHWSPEADYSSFPFFIRRMDTVGFFKPAEAPVGRLPLVGFVYITSGEVLVEIIKAVFIVNQMQETENILIPLEICAKYCEDTYLYFYDCFCNTDIIDAYLVDYWINESELGKEDADD